MSTETDAVAVAADLPSPPTATPDLLTDSAQRARQALEDVLAVVKEYESKTSDYFGEQVARGSAVIEEVRTALLSLCC